jgi:hypothetical protein
MGMTIGPRPNGRTGPIFDELKHIPTMEPTYISEDGDLEEYTVALIFGSLAWNTLVATYLAMWLF